MPHEMCLQVPSADAGTAIDMAANLGWKGVCLLADKHEFRITKTAINTDKHVSVDRSVGLLLEPRSRNDLKKQVSNNRRNFKIIAIHPKDIDISRAAVETKGVDMLLGWESVGQTSHERVIDYVMVKLAAENGVAIAFSLQTLLSAYDRGRAGIMSKYLEAARFVRKYNTPLIITSGALSPWDLRSASELTAFGKVLGFNGKDIKQAISGEMIQNNRKRLSGKWIMPGVELE